MAIVSRLASLLGVFVVFCTLLSVAVGIKLRVVHFNDVHGRIEAANRFQGRCTPEDKEARGCFGGFAKVAAVVKEKRAEGDDLIVLDAGDEFLGTVWSTVYMGNATAEILNQIGVDAFTLGNHEFDFGPSVLGTFVDQLNMPVLSSNLNVDMEPELKGKVAPYTILYVKGVKVGVVGSITPETAFISNLGKFVTVTDVAKAMQKAIDDLKAKGVCLIIGLTHQGYDDDIELVSKLTSIDIIIGGHSHTKPETYPKILKNKDGVDVAVVQAFWGTRYVGYLEADFNDGGELQLARGELIGLGDDPNDPESFVEDDQEIAATIEKLKGPVADFDTTVLGTTEVFLNAERDTVRTSDTNLGSLICEAMVLFIQTETSIEEAFGPTNACLINSGSIRSSIREGEITAVDVATTLPFENVISVLSLSATEIYEALENGVRQAGEAGGEFPQISGMRFKFCVSLPVGERITSVEIFDGANFVPIKRDDSSTKFNFITNGFLANGGNNFTVLAEAEQVFPVGPPILNAVNEYIMRFSPINAGTDGRIAEECPP